MPRHAFPFAPLHATPLQWFAHPTITNLPAKTDLRNLRAGRIGGASSSWGGADSRSDLSFHRRSCLVNSAIFLLLPTAPSGKIRCFGFRKLFSRNIHPPSILDHGRPTFPLEFSSRFPHVRDLTSAWKRFL